MSRACQGVFGLALMALSGAGHAQMFGEKLQIHGFASWGYGETDGNRYQLGTEAGSYENVSFALNLNARPSENLTIAGQVEWTETDEGLETELDYIFAEWRFTDRARVRFGQVQHPFGIYTEVFSVGTVRPFLELPQGIYGPQGFVAEAYRGIGFLGDHHASSGWGLQYDLYVGEIETEIDHPFFSLLAELTGQPLKAFDLTFTDVVGARVIALTPIPDLSFGLSAYSGSPNPDEFRRHPLEDFLDLNERRKVYGSQIEYLTDHLWLRLEYATLLVGEVETDGAYAEAAYKLTGHWQTAVRYDWTEISVNPLTLPPEALMFDLMSHEDWGLALNYWFTPDLVLKLEYHRVDGNRFAAPDPDDILLALITGQLESRTNLFQFGAQFSF